ncbi:hypothetical protein [Pseudanabaena sp. 'Roaring Creek']|uniref:hypothetical protein n=1 Tax=Pseudanabaena sp. 'Roaring Creek' TaxID=1681830 RepID=UPI0006D77330|nr:hypothetical protein [Pseudanabaena sp. 'Roaring Creek']
MKNFRFKAFSQIFKQVCLGIGGAAIAQLSLLANPSFAAPNYITLKVYPADLREPSPICPSEVTLIQASRPYYEGGYTLDGSASLSWLAQPFTLEKSDEFSATWVAKLQNKYRNCKATAGITRVNNEPFEGNSYLRMRFVNNKVYLILDMTGKTDVNGFTPVIVKKDVKDGNPIWSWAGTD